MKKTFYLKYIFSLFLVECLFIFNAGCGLDVFTMLDPPHNATNIPTTTTSYESQYFEFYTNEIGSTQFDGTSIYYRIYNSPSILNSDVSNLQSVANDSENSVNAPSRLIDTYKYQVLRGDGVTDEPLIPYTGENKKVYIRLSDYKGIEEYSARIMINDEDFNGVKTIPLRNLSSKATFNFGGSTTYDIKPDSDDEDVKYSSSYDNGETWYVAMFALAVGHDTTYTPIYSNILYLGAVPIYYSDRS